MNNDKIYIPPIKIQGIKTKIVPYIKENIVVDNSTIWVEPFMGSGVVGFNIQPQKAIFCDINPYLIDFYNAIKNKKITPYIVKNFLENEGKKLEHNNGAYYYEVRERFNKSHDPLDFLFLNRSCFNGMIRFNKDKKFNVPFGHKPYRFSKAYITKITNQVEHVSFLLSMFDWSFSCQHYTETLRILPENSFIYCDPPYIGRHVDYYDTWNEDDENRLYNLLKNSSSKFMLSTWDYNEYRKNKYLDTIWKDCYKINIEHFYHIGAKENHRNPMVEALLTNYETTGNSNKIIKFERQLTFDDVLAL